MFRQKTRSVISLNLSDKELRVIPQKNIFETGIAKIFSKEPSHLGYKEDVDNLINDIGLKEEDFLYLAISSLEKIVRNKNDTRIITSYLFSMQNLIKLLKGNNESNKTEQDILKDLLNLSRSITYEKYQKNHIIFRLGDIGTTAYIILRGNVDVLIKNFKIMGITKFDYLFYLANLIRYNEYGLLNEVINVNFNVFPVELEESNDIFENKFKIKTKQRNNTFQNLEEFQSNSNNLKDNLNIFKKINTDQGNPKRTSQNQSKNNNFKLNENSLAMKLYKKPFRITEEKLLEIFNLKRIHNKNLHCSYPEYINRLKLIPDDYKFYINEQLMDEVIKENEKENEEEKGKEKENINKKKDKNEDKNTIYYLKIFAYIKVVNMGKGTLFGELALTQENSLRTATIITSKECDITVLNKKTFNNILRKGAAVYIKKLLSFFVDLPIFNGISEYIFYHKYYTFLSKKIISRGNILINQGEPPKGIILLQSGSYGISSRISLDSLTNLIFHLVKENINAKNNKNNEDTKRYQKLLLKVNKMIYKTNSLINDNPKFKKFYLNEINIRVSELASPDIIGFKEYVNDKGLYAFTIEAHSTENIFYILDHKFYSEILHKNYIIRNNQLEFSEKKINVMINRLIILRNCLVNFFFENTIEKMNSIISKEMDILNYTKMRQKSALKKRITEYNFINNGKEFDYKNKRSGRNNKIKYFNSYNEAETVKNDVSKKNISFNLNLYANLKNKHSSNQINRISNNETKLYKTSKNFFKKENKKKFILESKNTYSKINNLKVKSFNKNIKENIYKLNIKDKDETNNYFYFNQNKGIDMNLPRMNSSVNSCRNIKYTGIILNNMVLEEINKKMKNNMKFNDNTYKIKDHQLISSLMTSEEKLSNASTDYNKIILQYKYPYLKKSTSELSFKKNIRIKSKLIRNIMTSKHRDSSMNKDIRITLDVKRMFSPLEISSTKSKENSITNKIRINNNKDKNRVKLNQKFFNNNLKSRLKLFYHNFKNTKK